MFAVCHIKRCAEYRMAMTVPSSAHLFHFLFFLSDLLSVSGLCSVFLAYFNFLSSSLLAVCVTKLLDSLLVDSAVKCINSPSRSLIWYSDG